MIEQLQHLFTRTVTIEPWASENALGVASYGTAVSYGCRIEPTTVRMPGENATLMGATKILLKSYVQVDPRDRVSVSSAYGSRGDTGAFESPVSKILQVKYLDDASGPIATVLICGKG